MSSFSCLSNYIGIRGFCVDGTPDSELFVNDLPGINLQMIANLANEEQQSFSGVWDEIRRRSIAMMEADTLTRMQRYFSSNILLSNQLSGRFRTDYADFMEAAGDFRRGTLIENCLSKNTEFFINSLDVYFDTAHSGTFTIYDTNDGSVLDTVDYTAVVGINTFQISKEYFIFGQRKRIFISYDANNSGTQETKVSTCFCGDSGQAHIRGAQVAVGTAVLKENLTLDGNTHGMVLNFNVQCSISNLICSMKELLKFSLWYKMGEQLMLERQTSDRINFYTMANPERVQELKELYTERYENSMDDTLNNLEPQGDELCFPCRKHRMLITAIP